MSDLITLVTQARSELIEPTPGFWAQQELKDWANEGAKELAVAAKLDTGPVTFVTVAGTELYAVAADFGQMIRMERFLDGDRYAEMLPLPPDFRLVTDGSPIGYSIFANQIQLIPVPDGAYTMRYRYFAEQPTLVNDTDVPILPEMYHKLIKWYMIMKAKLKADDSAYQVYQQDYKEGMQKMITTLEEQRQGSRFRLIRDVDNEMDNY